MTARISYTKVTRERIDAEIVTVRQLLSVLQEAGDAERVRVEITDHEGHIHAIDAVYVGETTGLHLQAAADARRR